MRSLPPLAAAVAALAIAAPVHAQRPGGAPAAAPDGAPSAPHDTIRVAGAAVAPTPTHEEHVTTHHAATIAGQRIEYDATVGNIMLRDTADVPIASVFYTAYIRRGVPGGARRPVMFAYNGGPGSSSVWVQMGAFGPRRVATPDTAHAPPPPYSLVDNAYSPLDRTDLVFIDPVGTGFSKPLHPARGTQFWGVDEDVRALSQFIGRWISANDRWNSPRYLAGESYGTTRSAALVNYLQSRDNMDFNGIILMSSVLDFQTITFDPGNLMPYVMYLPSYAAVAYYHRALPQQPAQLRPFLQEVERWATTEYAAALMQGDRLPAADRARVLDRLAQYTGVRREVYDRADLRLDAGQFEEELLRARGEVVGRLDARFLGPVADPLEERAAYDPQSAAVSSAYTSAFNDYLHGELGFGKDRQYLISGNVQPWNWTHGQARGWPGHTNVAVDLAEAIRRNPHLHVLLNSGLYDLATPYYAAEWTMTQLQLPAALRGNVQLAEYDAGHMMYLYEPALAKLRQSVVSFIDATSGAGTPATAGRRAAGGTAAESGGH